MPANASIDAVLPRVRRVVLRLRAQTEGTCTFGLSWLTWQLMSIDSASSRARMPGRYTSRAPKSLRGTAQACLAILAREGIMFGRTHPEPAVQRYEHGETDKRFRVRITQSQAAHRLSHM